MTASPRGLFVTLEGVDGAGKTTQTARLAAALRAAGREVVVTREPGGSPGAEDIRRLLVEGEPGRWSPWTELLLFTAARRDHLERSLRPALARGAVVLCDRFVDSTRAYQTAAREAGTGAAGAGGTDASGPGASRPGGTAPGWTGPGGTGPGGTGGWTGAGGPDAGGPDAGGTGAGGTGAGGTGRPDRAAVDALHAQAIGLDPDLTLIFDIDPAEALARGRARGGPERFERLGAGFQTALRAAYRAIAAAEPARCAVIDAAGDPDAVFARAWAALAPRAGLAP